MSLIEIAKDAAIVIGVLLGLQVSVMVVMAIVTLIFTVKNRKAK